MRAPFYQILTSNFLWNIGFLKKKSWLGSGIPYLAASLEKAGFKVDILDLDTCIPSKFTKITHEVSKKYKFIGISFITLSYPLALKLAKICKKSNPESKIIFGGPHASFTYNEILKSNSCVDYIIVGEGEKAIVDLVAQKHYVSGLAYRNSNNEVVLNPVEQIDDLDSIPFPARDKCKAIHYSYSREIPVITSRGCPMKCSFCVESRLFQNVRFRSPGNVAEEIEYLLSRNQREILIYDSNFAYSKKHVRGILEEFKRRNFKFDKLYCLAHVNFIDQEFLNSIRSVQIKDPVVEIGVENFSSALLRIGKTLNIEQYRFKLLEMLQYGSKIGIRFTLNYMIPFSEQKKEQVLDEIKLLRKYGRIHLFFLTPYPGIPLWDKIEDKLLTKDFSKFNSHHLVYNQTDMTEKDMRDIYRCAFTFKLDCRKMFSVIPPFHKKIYGWH